MLKKPEEVFKDLRKEAYAPVYFLHGEESYYLDVITNYIEKNALSEAERGFNQIILYGKDTQVSQVLNQARRYPMMASRQVVIVKELQDMADWNKKDSQALVESYLENVQESTILVLNYKHKSFNKNNKLYKALNKHAIIVESKKLYENQVPDWIDKFIKHRGYQIEGKAKQLLVEAVGADLARLSTELDKLLLNVKPEKPIAVDAIEKYVGISKDYNVFELQKALGIKDSAKALRILNYWQANPKKQPLIPTLSLLFNFFSKILLAYAQSDRSDSHLAQTLKVNPFFVKDYKTAMKHYKLGQIVAIIGFIRQADLQAKGIIAGASEDGEIMRELIFKILHQ